MELFGVCLGLEFEMESIILLFVFIDPLFPDIDHIMMLLDNFIQFFALMDDIFLDVCLLDCRIHPFSFLPLLCLLRVYCSQ